MPRLGRTARTCPERASGPGGRRIKNPAGGAQDGLVGALAGASASMAAQHAPHGDVRRDREHAMATARAGGDKRQPVLEAHRLAERVADAADGLDEPRLAVRLGLAAQVADVDLERVRGRAEVEAPDALEDQRARAAPGAD